MKSIEELEFERDYHSTDESIVYVKYIGDSTELYVFNTNGNWGYCFGEEELSNSLQCTYSSYEDCMKYLKMELDDMKSDINELINKI